MPASEHRIATLSVRRHGTMIRVFIPGRRPNVKHRKRLPFRNSRSLAFWSAAGRAAASIAESTIAPLMERLGETVAGRRHPAIDKAASRQRQGMSSDEITRRQAQDEQDMFDAQQPFDSAGRSP